MDSIAGKYSKYGLHDSWQPVLGWLDWARPSFCGCFDMLVRRREHIVNCVAQTSSDDRLHSDPVAEALSPLIWSYEDALREIEDKMRRMATRMELLFFDEIDRRYGLDLHHHASEDGYGIVNAYFPNGVWNGFYPDFEPIIQLLAHIAGGRSWQEMAVNHIERMISMRLDARDVNFEKGRLNGRLVCYGLLRPTIDKSCFGWDRDTRLALKQLFSLIAYCLGHVPDYRNLISEEEFDRIANVGYSVSEQVFELKGLKGFNIYANIVGRLVFVVKDERLSQRLADFPKRPIGSAGEYIRQFFFRVVH